MQGVCWGDLQMLVSWGVAPRTPHAGAIFSSPLYLQARAATQPARSARQPAHYQGRCTLMIRLLLLSTSCLATGRPYAYAHNSDSIAGDNVPSNSRSRSLD